MDEEKQTTEETTTENSNDGNKPQAGSLIDGANAAAERLEEANKKQEELLNRQEEIYAKQQLAGRAEAGNTSEAKEESPEDYAKRVMSNEE